MSATYVIMGSRFSMIPCALHRWSPHSFWNIKIITCMRLGTAHSIDIVRSTAPFVDTITNNQTTLTLFTRDGSSSHARRSTIEHTIENGSTDMAVYLWILYAGNRPIARIRTEDAAFAFASSVYELLLKAKPLFGLINLPDVLRCCILVP